ncbi:MAG: DNA topoisomerase (ATP-hydrolyzing) subunit B [Candidatus Harrisonbacteria bacterium CG10_big_fil_rev_8_21_14_0_10_42_17]|uniref:DNA gyrase subunit B n=1 Tax=Candidatus Harrisonbacteria bacterium CG10_big_fil_rev_8_21_14_0_10_42_17 TaxID=1974584 RepID=A0A2M6WGT7_9BACT|nr:MAG: DNA topoisomerase (ATP-hydrolyzing) subunit B [Candidatus Harrisonbacteria bacterium CG10_big_fil_rev_8_21_14_0_10_42_17]
MPTKKEEKEEKKKPESSYGAKDIYVLEGLDPVRKRPGMYIGSTGVDGLHHLIWEVVDNSIDEAMAGYADHIRVELYPKGKVTVADNGRGIPVEMHKQTKTSALETVMTTLHAGGKFGGESYKVSGGLHGVGVSVVNALSTKLKAEVCRDGSRYVQEYKCGKATANIKKIGKSKTSGTRITFEPDPEIFAITEFNWKQIIHHLRQQAFLTKGVRIEIADFRTEKPQYEAFYFDGGLLSFLRHLSHDKSPLQEKPFYVHKSQGDLEVEVAFHYLNELETSELSFANNIYTPDGGMHLTGFRSALTRSLNDFLKNGSGKKDESLSGDDVREGLSVIVSVKLREPQFEGQTKARLGNPEARTAVESIVGEELKNFLERNSSDARRIAEKGLLALKARKAAKAAKDMVLRKGALEGLTLPGKLADCTSRNPEESELFIVEGDSAGGSAKSGRDRNAQAILPLRGKILNVEKARIDKMMANKEVKSLVVAIGTAIGESFEIEKIRYHKIIIMTDADVDGAHISTLLLTLFYRYFPKIIERGYLYIAKPPLYQVSAGKEARYVYNDKQKDDAVLELQKSKKTRAESEKEKEKPEESLAESVEASVGTRKVNIQRYKGLGEMNPNQLWETTMNPETRHLKQVEVGDAEVANRLFSVLMGEEVAPRKQFIQSHALFVKNLDI